MNHVVFCVCVYNRYDIILYVSLGLYFMPKNVLFKQEGNNASAHYVEMTTHLESSVMAQSACLCYSCLRNAPLLSPHLQSENV